MHSRRGIIHTREINVKQGGNLLMLLYYSTYLTVIRFIR